jgi:hypothetical protein
VVAKRPNPVPKSQRPANPSAKGAIMEITVSDARPAVRKAPTARPVNSRLTRRGPATAVEVKTHAETERERERGREGEGEGEGRQRDGEKHVT